MKYEIDYNTVAAQHPFVLNEVAKEVSKSRSKEKDVPLEDFNWHYEWGVESGDNVRTLWTKIVAQKGRLKSVIDLVNNPDIIVDIDKEDRFEWETAQKEQKEAALALMTTQEADPNCETCLGGGYKPFTNMEPCDCTVVKADVDMCFQLKVTEGKNQTVLDYFFENKDAVLNYMKYIFKTKFHYQGHEWQYHSYNFDHRLPWWEKGNIYKMQSVEVEVPEDVEYWVEPEDEEKDKTPQLNSLGQPRVTSWELMERLEHLETMLEEVLTAVGGTVPQKTVVPVQGNLTSVPAGTPVSVPPTPVPAPPAPNQIAEPEQQNMFDTAAPETTELMTLEKAQELGSYVVAVYEYEEGSRDDDDFLLDIAKMDRSIPENSEYVDAVLRAVNGKKWAGTDDGQGEFVQNVIAKMPCTVHHQIRICINEKC